MADPEDRRRLDMVLYGVDPTGLALCCDATMVSPLSRTGEPITRAADRDGVALRRARKRKRRRYRELLAPGPSRLVVLGCEVGGRWNREALRLVASLRRFRCRRAPALLRRSAELAWDRRWWGLLSIAAQDALAATLVEGCPAFTTPPGFDTPHLADVLDVAVPPASPSLLPLRG